MTQLLQERSEKGMPGGYAGLDGAGQLESQQLPASVGAGLAAETAARIAADSAEATARATADALLQPLSGKDQPSGYAGLSAGSKIAGAEQTYGAAANTACQGNDSRLSDSRAPSGAAGGSLAGTYPNPTIAAGAVTDNEVAAANKDGAAGTASMRTLGTGAAQAAAGNHTHTTANITDYVAPTSFTPALKFGGANTGMTGTFTGTYSQIGKIATIVINIALTAKGSSTGAVTITGLPVTPAGFAGGAAIHYANLSGAGLPLALANASTTLTLRYAGSATDATALADTNFTNTSQVIFTFTVLVA